MERAEAAGDAQAAEKYRDLADSARDAADHYTDQIESGESGMVEGLSGSGEDSAPQDSDDTLVDQHGLDEPEDQDYRIAHRAPGPEEDGTTSSLAEVGSDSDKVFPKDVLKHPDRYGAEFSQTARQVKAAAGDPDAEVTVYRAVPPGTTVINRGDWVSLSHEYALRESYGALPGGEDGVVISGKAKASELYSEGYLEEWGYNGSQDLETAPKFDHHPLAIGDDEPTVFPYIHNPESSTVHGVDPTAYGQDIEPAGRYLNEGFGGPAPEGMEAGEVTFQRPLRVDYGTFSKDWKQRMSDHYDGKTGKELSQAIRSDGYDAIITSDSYGTTEVVDLTGTSSAEPGGASKPGKWDRRRKYSPKDSGRFGAALSERYGVELNLRGGPDGNSYVALDKITVPEEKRGTGIGRKVMSDVVAEADRNGWRMSLTPDSEWGSSVPRLKQFYKEFGFTENKGRSRDFETQESMIRQPKTA